MEFVKESHYQLACTRYYELTHGVWTVPFFCNHINYFNSTSNVNLTSKAMSAVVMLPEVNTNSSPLTGIQEEC